ncbi:MAG TPA: lipase family protein [Kribbella sp.]|nr:lipase family protein [Kribbella sp.]
MTFRTMAGRLLGVLTAGALTAGALSALAAQGAVADDGPGCDQQCLIDQAWAAQRANALPRTSFYDAPQPLPWRPAGTLIRAETAGDYRETVPATATRILYHSRTAGGRDIAASGVVLTPLTSPPSGGWPVVVDAHGTSGTNPDCAPSLMKNLYHGNQMAAFLARGWAVVAPDYAGLGVAGGSEYLNKTAEANDVLGSVTAARRAVPQLSRRWVLWGHSQGGQAALAVAERQVDQPDPGYLGAVVTSPAALLPELIANAAYQPAGPLPLSGLLPLIAGGAKVTHPELALDQVLTPEALSRLHVADTGCLDVVAVTYADLTGDALVQPNHLSEPSFHRYLRSNTAGESPVRGPVLLLQGTADTLTPAEITDRTAAALCQQHAQLDYRKYPGLWHDTIPWLGSGIDDGAMPDILAWTADRFAGAPASSTCP